MELIERKERLTTMVTFFKVYAVTFEREDGSRFTLDVEVEEHGDEYNNRAGARIKAREWAIKRNDDPYACIKVERI